MFCHLISVHCTIIYVFNLQIDRLRELNPDLAQMVQECVKVGVFFPFRMSNFVVSVLT